MLYLFLYIILLNKLKLMFCFNIPCNNRHTFISTLNSKTPSKIYSQDPKILENFKKFNVIGNIDEWKRDMDDMAGNWYMFYPHCLIHVTRIFPNPNIRDSPLFLDKAGRVLGPDEYDSPIGSYMLDSKDYHHLIDNDNFLHSRRCVIILQSSEFHNNLRLILAGRVYYSDPIESREFKMVTLRPAIFLGQAFLEDFNNEAVEELMDRLGDGLIRYDKSGAEVDPRNWRLYSLTGRGSPFQWLYGKDNWKLLGPFTSYKGLDDYSHERAEEDPFVEEQYYNIVDPLELNNKKHVHREELDEVVTQIVRAVFTGRVDMDGIRIENEEYLKALKEEMVALGERGPDYYKGSFE